VELGPDLPQGRPHRREPFGDGGVKSRPSTHRAAADLLDERLTFTALLGRLVLGAVVALCPGRVTARAARHNQA
jgi:hypothetical protein